MTEDPRLTEYLDKVHVDEQGVMHWPMLVVYEEHEQSDFIEDVAEDVVLEEYVKVRG